MPTPESFLDSLDLGNPHLDIEIAEYRGQKKMIQILEAWHKKFMEAG